jgi:hypothetical protein
VSAQELTLETLAARVGLLEYRADEMEAGLELAEDRTRNLAGEVGYVREDLESLRPPRICAPRLAVPGRGRGWSS